MCCQHITDSSTLVLYQYKYVAVGNLGVPATSAPIESHAGNIMHLNRSRLILKTFENYF